MTDAQPSITLRTRFRRAMQVQQFEPIEAEVFVEQTFPGEMAPEDVQAHVAGMFLYCKSNVFDQLGLGYTQDETTGIIMEAFPGTEVVGSTPSKTDSKPSPPRKAPKAPTAAKSIPEPYTEAQDAEADEYEEEPEPRPTRRPSSSSGSRSGSESGGARHSQRPRAKVAAMTDDELWEHLEQNPGEWFDNRESKTNPKAPDYRAKNIPARDNPQYKAGLWDRNAPDWFENPFD